MLLEPETLAKEFDKIIQFAKTSDKDILPTELEKMVSFAIISTRDETVKYENIRKDIALSVLDSQELPNKRIIAICLLRLIGEPIFSWLSESPWRPKVIALIENQLTNEIYREWKIDLTLMSHEKIERLAESVRELDKNLDRALASLTSLDQLRNHRQKLFSTLNGKSGRLLIRPFLPNETEASLNEMYTRAENYIEQRTSLSVVESRSRLIEESDNFIKISQSYGTLYSNLLAEKIAKTLKNLVDSDFANSTVAKPAQISVHAIEKKYTLHLQGERINLGLNIKNEGSGYAYESILKIESSDEDKLCFEFFEDSLSLGRIPPLSSQVIQIPLKVIQPKSQLELLTSVNWQNYDGTEKQTVDLIQIDSQRNDIDWQFLKQKDVYSLEPVTDERELVGRDDLLSRLLATAKSSTVGSSVIQGQKRVGKTSIARAIQSRLTQIGYIVVYLEGGNYVMPTAKATISRLGVRLCKEIIRCDTKLSSLAQPEFDDALSPLDEFLDDVRTIIPDRQIVVILDEFDELPLDLYVRGPLGDAFFLTLRSISSHNGIGVILVGGEKMAHIMDCQADKLNKWNVVRVDYFSRDTDWTDYKELVQSPVKDILEYTEDSIVALNEVTAGNPYFTKLVCRSIFSEAINRRDCHITRAEVNQAVSIALREIERNTFQHFWEDGIFETGERAAERSVLRRRILIAVSDVLDKSENASFKAISEHLLLREASNLKSDLQEFVTRRILDCKSKDDFYMFKVPLFHFWLKEQGVQDVIATFASLNAAIQERTRLEKLKVQSQEIVRLVNNWGTYKGQPVTEDKVRAWLGQFDNVVEQRLMFSVLKNLRFYTNAFVRQKMREIHSTVTKGLVHTITKGQLKRDDFLISYLDNPSKSGAMFAKHYADEASIYVDNVVEKSRLKEAIIKNEKVQAVIFIDDFVGTGQQASENLISLVDSIQDVIRQKNIRLVFVVVIAFIDGWRKVEQVINQLSIPVIVRYCELLDETAQCFSETSQTFQDADERRQAKEIAIRQGKKLEKDCPIGYGNLGLAVVFEHGCPNDTLPILWSESITPPWIPLFRRH